MLVWVREIFFWINLTVPSLGNLYIGPSSNLILKGVFFSQGGYSYTTTKSLIEGHHSSNVEVCLVLWCNLFIYQARQSLAWSQQGFWRNSFCRKHNLWSVCLWLIVLSFTVGSWRRHKHSWGVSLSLVKRRTLTCLASVRRRLLTAVTAPRLSLAARPFTKPPLFQRNRLTCSGNLLFESCVEGKGKQREIAVYSRSSLQRPQHLTSSDQLCHFKKYSHGGFDRCSSCTLEFPSA